MTAGSGTDGIAWIGTSAWAYPVLEAAHIVGIGLLIGNLVLFELRVWGRAPELPLRSLARLALTAAVVGFGIAAASGALMFASKPAELLANRAFVVKMTLLLLAGLNAAWFHARGSLDAPDGTARALTLLSLGLWLAVIACGRWIAYV